MRYKQAMEIVAEVAKKVPAINGAEHSGEGWQRFLKLPVIEGRSISVDAEYGDPHTWFRHDKGKDPTVDRVRLKCGHCRTEGGRHGKSVTRTFRVRDDGTLNEKGIEKALRELAEIQQREVVHGQAVSEREARERDAKLHAYRVLGNAGLLAIHGYLDESKPIEHRVSSYGRADAEGLDVQISVNHRGQVKLTLEGLTPEEAMIALRRAGWEKSAEPLKQDV